MALMAKDIPVTRALVEEWIDAWNDSGKSETLEAWVRRHVKELRLDDDMVVTSAHETLGETTSLADMIVLDLPSYANAPNQ